MESKIMLQIVTIKINLPENRWKKTVKNVEIHTSKVGCTEELSVSCLGKSADHL